MMDEFNGLAEHYAIGQAMVVYGGSFSAALGKALQVADKDNQRKIRETWPADWEKYRGFALYMAEKAKES